MTRINIKIKTIKLKDPDQEDFELEFIQIKKICDLKRGDLKDFPMIYSKIQEEEFDQIKRIGYRCREYSIDLSREEIDDLTNSVCLQDKSIMCELLFELGLKLTEMRKKLWRDDFWKI